VWRGGGSGGISKEWQRRQREQREARGVANEKKLNARAEKGEKGNVPFPDPAYIQ
jgi:hypothetical protein